jgi:hypothetical protein
MTTFGKTDIRLLRAWATGFTSLRDQFMRFVKPLSGMFSPAVGLGVG